MSMPASAHDVTVVHAPESFWSRYVFSTDHKVIGLQYMFTGMAMALLGGFMAYVFRMQLAFPDQVRRLDMPANPLMRTLSS